LQKMLTDIRAGVALCQEHCEYFSVCGGGEPVNKLFENGGFASTETTYCRMTKKRATDLVLDRLDQIHCAADDDGAPDSDGFADMTAGAASASP
jgi:uncharacterized protein